MLRLDIRDDPIGFASYLKRATNGGSVSPKKI